MNMNPAAPAYVFIEDFYYNALLQKEKTTWTQYTIYICFYNWQKNVDSFHTNINIIGVN